MLLRTNRLLGNKGGPSGSPSLPTRAVTVLSIAALLFASGALLSRSDVPRAVSAPGRADDLSNRALEYLQTARAEADPTYYAKAEKLLRRSLDLQPDENFRAYVGMASLANGRHDFTGSVRWSRRAIAANPHNADAYGLLGDALFELGKTRAADLAYQQMIDIRPDLASYVRASYSHQYRGNTREALRAMRLALQSAGPVGESPAWIRHQLGDIYFGLGRLDEALHQNRAGTKLAPGYVPPTVGMAEVFIARGRLDKAIGILERAVKEFPALEYTIKLGDLYAATGRHGRAERWYRATSERLADYRANGVLPDVDFILFYADHGLRPGAALQEVQRMFQIRPTAAVAEAYAWTLHLSGRSDEAFNYARRSLAIPSVSGDAYFRAATIAADSSHPRAARTWLKEALAVEWQLPVLIKAEARQLAEDLGI